MDYLKEVNLDIFLQIIINLDNFYINFSKNHIKYY